MNRIEKADMEKRLQDNLQLIETVLQEFLPQDPLYQKTIFEAMEYSLMGGGKRIRPMMMLEAFRLFEGQNLDLLKPFLAAMEMIHTYSLVHDDLPAMDNDEYRRGRKTTHVVFGEDMGILAGDGLLNYAYETAAGALENEEQLLPAAQALKILADKAGIYGMVGGQVVDVEKTGHPLAPEELDYIYRMKTAALLEASLMIGAVLAGASKEEVLVMEQAGSKIGMAFQIQDDILDRTSTTQELGKPVHSDEKNEKTTYVSLYGMKKSHQLVEQYSEEAVALLEALPYENPFLKKLIETLINRKK